MGDGQRQQSDGEAVEELSVTQSIEHLFQEARILLPGAVTLFGFQLVVVFDGTFQDRLGRWDQRAHLLALLLVAFSIALLMAPVTYDRQVEPEIATRRFLRIASRLLTAATVPLALAIALEIFLVSQVILVNQLASLAISAAILVVYLGLWHVYPRLSAQSARSGHR